MARKYSGFGEGKYLLGQLGTDLKGQAKSDFPRYYRPHSPNKGNNKIIFTPQLLKGGAHVILATVPYQKSLHPYWELTLCLV